MQKRKVNMKTREFVEKWCRGFRLALCLLVFSSICFLGIAPPVHAKHGNECTQESLRGSYGYVFSGLQFPSAPSAVGAGPVAAAGLFVFDGEGGLIAQDTFNNGVMISHRTGAGTYTVDSDCTGSAQLGGGFASFSFYFVIVSREREFSLLVTNPGTLQPGVAIATGDEECTLASFKGAYRNTRQDYTVPFFSVVNAGLEVGTFDGKGTVFFPPVTQSRNGVFAHPTATGTYTVSSNCIATLDLLIVDGATSVHRHREGVIVDGGNQALFVGATGPGGVGGVGTAQFKKRFLHGENEERERSQH
jgi:hypothetical protein